MAELALVHGFDSHRSDISDGPKACADVADNELPCGSGSHRSVVCRQGHTCKPEGGVDGGDLGTRSNQLPDTASGLSGFVVTKGSAAGLLLLDRCVDLDCLFVDVFV